MFKNLCPEVRGRIVGQWQAGRSVADIAADIPCSTKTVRTWIQRYAEGGDHALHDRRPRRTTRDEDENLVASMQQRPFGTVAEAIQTADVDISDRTARRRLNEAGLHCYRPAHKIPLTPEHREQRVAFALDSLATSREKWEATI
ncbi:hypothetical protein X777_10730 [Ooceraea biroi]|uniref:Uncharacterized protein n=1 Tax=Ooceraea biroi TaxID=2015173 RepID=A0A026W390_OOCBI|nr:hypothetical protein X777_10730 [Ooceraea biroi]